MIGVREGEVGDLGGERDGDAMSGVPGRDDSEGVAAGEEACTGVIESSEDKEMVEGGEDG